MFPRVHSRKKHGKIRRYFSVVENRRVATGNIVQRQVLYLGEINAMREARLKPAKSTVAASGHTP